MQEELILSFIVGQTPQLQGWISCYGRMVFLNTLDATS
jgi:hypothetical protein